MGLIQDPVSGKAEINKKLILYPGYESRKSTGFRIRNTVREAN
jgi:hypothetical protein